MVLIWIVANTILFLTDLIALILFPSGSFSRVAIEVIFNINNISPSSTQSLALNPSWLRTKAANSLSALYDLTRITSISSHCPPASANSLCLELTWDWPGQNQKTTCHQCFQTWCGARTQDNHTFLREDTLHVPSVRKLFRSGSTGCLCSM